MKRKTAVFVVLIVLTFAVCCLIGCQPNSEPPEHTHKFEGEWHSDENYHWLECECGEKGMKSEHEFDDNVCTECGYKKGTKPEHTHKFEGEWHSDESGHWKECSCGEKGTKSEHEFTEYVVEGDKHYQVCVCGVETEKTAHDYGDEWFSDGSKHWHKCVCGAESEKIAHSYTEYVVEGDKHYQVCECGAETDKVAHTYSEYVVEGDKHYQVCVCGAETDKVAHTYSEYVVEGDKHYQVCVCGAETDKVAHTYADYVIEGDKHYQVCECGAETEKVEHAYNEYAQTETEHYDICICGKENPNKTIGDHKFVNGICAICNYSSDSIVNLGFTAINENECSVAGIRNRDVEKVIIPDKYQGKPVTSIGRDAFHSCSNLTSVTIPDSVTSIGRDAFRYSELIEVRYEGNIASWCNIEFGNYDSNPLYNGARLFIQGNFLDDKLVIPNEVTEIKDYAFYNCDNLTSVTIGDKVTSIGSSAFSGCCKLIEVCNKSKLDIQVGRDTFGYVGYYAKNVYKPEEGASKLIKNEDYAFYVDSEKNEYYLVSYKGEELSLTLPEDYEGNAYEIYQYAFYNNVNLQCVTIGENVMSIGDSAFNECSSLINVTIGENVTSIGDGAFSGCTSLRNIEIPNNVTSIGNHAFSGCNLTSVTIGDNVTSIGNHAFFGCQNLTSVMLGDGVTSIEIAMFAGCQNLTSVIIGNEVTSIGYGAFNECSSLTSIAIPDSVTSIGPYAFEACSNLKTVTLGDSVTNIGYAAFYGCDNLQYTIENVAKYLGNGENPYLALIEVISQDVTECKINDRTKLIADNAFEHCASLRSITIPESVTNIGNSTFSGCDSLISVTIPDNVTSIGSRAFSNCSSLTNVTIGENLTSIGDDAFRYCSNLTDVTIGENVTSIGSSAFSGCDNLTEVRYVGDIASWCNIEFGDGYSNPLYYRAKIYIQGVPLEGELIIPDEVTELKTYAFYGCDILTSITIGVDVTSIGDDAFRYCYKLIEVCNKSELNIEAGKETFGGVARYAKNVYKPEEGESKLIDYEDYTFYADDEKNEYYLVSYNGNETNITLPEYYEGNAYEIYQYAFYYNNNIESVTIGDNVTSIGESAFYNCRNLTNVTIGRNITSIGDWAFEDCNNLENVYYHGTKDNWQRIQIDIFSDYALAKATRYYFSLNDPYEDGTAEEGEQYWHYTEDGQIEVWQKH